MHSKGDSSYSNKNSECDVLTFMPDENAEIIKKLEKINFDDEELSNNYQSIDWYEYKCITVLLKNEEILGFSSVWHRPKYYGSDEVRILNRYWEHKKLRMYGAELARPHLISTIMHQLKYSKYFGFKKAFISREKNYRVMKKLIAEIQNKTNTQWTMDNKKVCICVPESPSCWQYKGETLL